MTLSESHIKLIKISVFSAWFGEAQHLLHLGTCAQDFDCWPTLQGGKQLPVVIQAEGTARLPEEEEPLHRG